MKATTRIAFLYTIIAIVAILVNILFQAMIIQIYSGLHAVKLSVLIGTIAGLPVKFFLEKIYIFNFKSKSLAHDGRIFMLYIFMSIFTTALFWLVEYIFHTLYGSHEMRYLGGAIGLIIGNIIKYFLDKRFVFREGVL